MCLFCLASGICIAVNLQAYSGKLPNKFINYIIIIDALDAILMMHMRALLYGCDSVTLISRLQFIHFRKWYRLKPLFRHMEKIMFIDALNTFLHTGCGNQFTLNVDMTLHLGEEKHHMPLIYSPIPVM